MTKHEKRRYAWRLQLQQIRLTYLPQLPKIHGTNKRNNETLYERIPCLKITVRDENMKKLST